MRSRVILVIAVVAMLVTACSVKTKAKEEKVRYDKNTVVFNEDGTVTEYVRETFPDKYDLKDFVAAMDSEIAAYNKATAADTVTHTEATAADGKISVDMTYRSVEDYALFNEVSVRVCDYVPAGEEIYETLSVVDASSGATMKTADITVSDAKACIFDTPYDICVNGKILYYSEGVLLEGDNHVSTQSGERWFIIYEVTK